MIKMEDSNGVKNLEVAKIFKDIASILEIKDENPFRIRAYERAAQTIENLTSDLEELSQKERLTELPGVGKDLALKIKEILKTGTLKQYEKLKKQKARPDPLSYFMKK